MFAVEEPRDDRRDWTMDHAVVSLGRIERLEICLDRLSRGLLDICKPGYVPQAEVKDMLDRVRCVSSVIRGLQHCFDMRQSLQARQNSLAQSLQTPPPESSSPKTSPQKTSSHQHKKQPHPEPVEERGEHTTTPHSSSPAKAEPATPEQKITGNIKAAKTMVAGLKKNILHGSATGSATGSAPPP
jgi:hypothetical protein